MLERNCVALVVGYEDRAAVVNGGEAWYTVRCYQDGMDCECTAGSRNAPHCAHRLAAAVVFAEYADAGRPFG